MKTALPLLLLIALACRHSSANVLQVTDENYDEVMYGKTIFIKFFAPWCGHCKAMAPDWEKLANEWKNHAIGLVAEVDCTEQQSLCEDFGVEGFPTLMYGDPLSPEIYEGDRDYESMAAFAKENISKPVCSARNTDHCSDEETAVIASLRKKSKEELDAVESKVADGVEAAQAVYDEALEKITEQFEQITKDFNSKIDEIRDATHYKWVQQILSEIEDATDESKAEL